jgi:hypothetical protein
MIWNFRKLEGVLKPCAAFYRDQQYSSNDVIHHIYVSSVSVVSIKFLQTISNKRCVLPYVVQLENNTKKLVDV